MPLQLNPIQDPTKIGGFNTNFQLIEDYINDFLLKRTGLSPGEANSLEVDIDLNSNDLLNVQNIGTQSLTVQGTPISTYINRAETAATNAETSETNAASSAASAASSASAAASSASSASASASAASTSETNAANSAAAAATSASEAATSETNAATSEANAASSASAAATSESDAQVAASDASNSADIAQASANFKGEWTSLTGSLAVPASVYHQSVYWQLLTDLGDVTTSEPGVSSDWALLSIPDFDLSGATLDLGFAAGEYALDDGEKTRTTDPTTILSVVRATSKRVIGPNGYYREVSPNTVAREWDPVTGKPKGALIEGSATNELLYSTQFDNAVWSKIAATVTTNAITAPDGTTTADKLVEDTSTGVHHTNQILTAIIGVHTVYVFAKAGERTRFEIGALGGTTQRGVGFDLSTGSTFTETQGGTISEDIGAEIKHVGNGVYLCSMSWTSDGQTQIRFYLNDGMGTSYTGDGTSGLYLWGAQLETGTRPTSPIITTDSPVTRAADDVDRIFGGEFNATKGTWIVELSSLGPTDTNQNILTIHDGTSNNRQRVYISQNQGSVFSFGVSGGSAINSESESVASVDNLRVAIRIEEDNFGLCVNGGNVLLDTGYPVPTLDRVTLGAGWSDQDRLLGHIQSVHYIPEAVSDAKLQEATA